MSQLNHCSWCATGNIINGGQREETGGGGPDLYHQFRGGAKTEERKGKDGCVQSTAEHQTIKEGRGGDGEDVVKHSKRERKSTQRKETPNYHKG